MLALRYIKSLKLWNEIIKLKKYNSLFTNTIFNPDSCIEKIRLLFEICPETIKGYRLHQNKNDTSGNHILEYGEWETKEYIRDWFYFSSYSLCFNEHSFHTLLKSIKVFSSKKHIDISDLLVSLWDEMWIMDLFLYSKLKQELVWDALPAEDKDIYNCYELVYDMIKTAKESVTNLDEWITCLHRIMPEAMYSADSSKKVGTEDANKYARFFEEVFADIGTIYDALAYSAIMIDDVDIFSLYMFNLSKGIQNETELYKQMRYDSASRIMFPSFWYDKAQLLLSHPESDVDDQLILRSLCLYDPVILIGYMCQEFSYNNKGIWFDIFVNKDIHSGKIDETIVSDDFMNKLVEKMQSNN